MLFPLDLTFVETMVYYAFEWLMLCPGSICLQEMQFLVSGNRLLSST